MSLHLALTPERKQSRFSLQRLVSIGSILALHAGFLFALQHGTLSKLNPFTPSEVLLTLATAAPDNKPEPPAPVKTSKLPLPQNLLPSPPVIPLPEIPAPATPSPITLASQSVSEAPPSTQASGKPAAPASEASNSAPRIINAVEYLRPPRANYPHHSRRMKEQGRVIMHVLVNSAGHPEKVDIHQSSGFPRLDDAARIAMMQAIFRPYMEDGKALSVIATATINFSLDT